MTREEAIDKLRRLCSPEQMNALKVLVPELAKSEDERIFDAIKNDIEQTSSRGRYLINGITRDEAVAWLEKQKSKEKSEKPIILEWSEDDEAMLWNVISIVGQCKSVQSEDILDWLKSLRPPFKDREMKLKILKYLSTRCSVLEFEEVEDYLNDLRPSWKPSEEQMEALDTAQMELCGTEYNEGLCSLIDDLKKL